MRDLLEPQRAGPAKERSHNKNGPKNARHRSGHGEANDESKCRALNLQASQNAAESGLRPRLVQQASLDLENAWQIGLSGSEASRFLARPLAREASAC